MVELLLAANPFAAMKPLQEDEETDTHITFKTNNDDGDDKATNSSSNSSGNSERIISNATANNMNSDTAPTLSSCGTNNGSNSSFNGALPLHLAVSGGGCLAVVQAVHRVHPEAAFTADCEGLLPIHYFSLRSNRWVSVFYYHPVHID